MSELTIQTGLPGEITCIGVDWHDENHMHHHNIIAISVHDQDRPRVVEVMVDGYRVGTLKRGDKMGVTTIQDRVASLEAAIRAHRDRTTGHGMCWENDVELWEVLGDKDVVNHTPPPPVEFMLRCLEYCVGRHRPSTCPPLESSTAKIAFLLRQEEVCHAKNMAKDLLVTGPGELAAKVPV